MVVQPDDCSGFTVATIALNHLSAEREPFATVRLDEESAFVTVHARLDDLHTFDEVGFGDRGHLGVELHFGIVAEHQPQGARTVLRLDHLHVATQE